MKKKESISFFKGPNRTRKNRRYTGEEKGQKLKESLPHIRKGMSIADVAKMVGVPFNTYYSWIVKLRRDGKESLEDQCSVKTEEFNRELQLAVEWLDRNGVKKDPTGFKKAKHNIKFKRSYLYLYTRYRESVRIAKKKK